MCTRAYVHEEKEVEVCDQLVKALFEVGLMSQRRQGVFTPRSRHEKGGGEDVHVAEAGHGGGSDGGEEEEKCGDDGADETSREESSARVVRLKGYAALGRMRNMYHDAANAKAEASRARGNESTSGRRMSSSSSASTSTSVSSTLHADRRRSVQTRTKVASRRGGNGYVERRDTLSAAAIEEDVDAYERAQSPTAPSDGSRRAADYDNSLQRKLVRLSREGVFGGPRSRDIALRDPFFCSHYRPVPRTLSSKHEHGGATQPRVPDGDEVARCGREMHLEAAMEEAQDMMAMLMTQLEYMQTELDIKSEEVRVIESSRFGVVHV